MPVLFENGVIKFSVRVLIVLFMPPNTPAAQLRRPIFRFLFILFGISCFMCEACSDHFMYSIILGISLTNGQLFALFSTLNRSFSLLIQQILNIYSQFHFLIGARRMEVRSVVQTLTRHSWGQQIATVTAPAKPE